MRENVCVVPKGKRRRWERVCEEEVLGGGEDTANDGYVGGLTAPSGTAKVSRSEVLDDEDEVNMV